MVTSTVRLLVGVTVSLREPAGNSPSALARPRARLAVGAAALASPLRSIDVTRSASTGGWPLAAVACFGSSRARRPSLPPPSLPPPSLPPPSLAATRAAGAAPLAAGALAATELVSTGGDETGEKGGVQLVVADGEPGSMG